MTASEREALVARVRARVQGNFGPQSETLMDTTDLLELVTEVERLTRERDAYAKAINAAYAALTENVYGTRNQLEYVERILAEARARTTGGRDA